MKIALPHLSKQKVTKSKNSKRMSKLHADARILKFDPYVAAVGAESKKQNSPIRLIVVVSMHDSPLVKYLFRLFWFFLGAVANCTVAPQLMCFESSMRWSNPFNVGLSTEVKVSSVYY